MKEEITYHRISVDDFYHALNQPSTLLIPYHSGFTLKVKLDIENSEFTVCEPHTVVTIERLYDSYGRGGLMFFQCPTCNARKKYLIRSPNEVKCDDCFTIDEFMSEWE